MIINPIYSHSKLPISSQKKANRHNPSFNGTLIAKDDEGVNFAINTDDIHSIREIDEKQ